MNPNDITIYAVFAAGLASLLTPCLFHIIPVYISYLLGETITKDNASKVNKVKLMINSLGFVIGLSITFILLGITATALGRYLRGNIDIFKRISAVIIIFLGLFQTGVIYVGFLNREVRYIKKFQKVNFFKSILFGMMFGFGWTPCFSAVLGGVLALAANAKTVAVGAMYLAIYSVGLSIPFILIALFINYIFKWIRVLNKYLLWIKIASGIILVIIGFSMLMEGEHEHEYEDWSPEVQETRGSENEKLPLPLDEEQSSGISHNEEGKRDMYSDIPFGVYEGEKAIDIGVRDIENNKVKLSDFYGKKVFLNFFATWCDPCRDEMPALEKIYNEYKNKDFVLLTVNYPAGEKGGRETVTKFMKDKNYSFNVYFDEYAEAFETYQILGIPTTIVIGRDGIIEKRVEGIMTEEYMRELVGE